MTQQAANCLQLYRGGNPVTIEKLLRSQKPSVLRELQDHFGTTDLTKLAIHLSQGK